MSTPPALDCFALLDEPHRPWLDAEALKQKFLKLSAQFHPDRFHNQSDAEREAAGRKFSEINAAYNCLREPKDRLRHLLELELGAKPADIQRVPAEVTEAFFEIGRLCQETDRFIAEKRQATSPLMKVQLFERAQEQIERLNLARQKIDARRDELLLELKGMNAVWDAVQHGAKARSELPLDRLDEIYRLFGYLGRWSEQLNERVVQLSFD